jgi:hypothetical protein
MTETEVLTFVSLEIKVSGESLTFSPTLIMRVGALGFLFSPASLANLEKN